LAGNGNTLMTLSIVAYKDEIEVFMEFLFCSTFVCRNLDVSKEIHFHRDI
jgi:chromosome segregation ATPase